LSPIIFNYWFKKYNIEGEYGFMEINEVDFNNIVPTILKEKDLCGLNITIPFKEKIIEHLHSIDKNAEKIGAVNCVSKTKEGFRGTNSDWIGFEESIKWQEKHNTNKIVKKEKAILIGYGGASKAILYSLLKTGFKKIRVFNRDFSKIKDLENISAHKLDEIENYFEEADLVINTVPINYNKDPTINITKTNFIEDQSVHTPHGFDACYNQNTFFLNHFNKRKRFYGLHMLIHQAVPCFHKWYGVRPDVDTKLVSFLETLLKQ
jgi:Shikimate 5-dehydrogenase